MAVVGKRLHALLVRAVRRAEGACFHEKWFIAVRRRSERDVLAGDMSGFILLVAPRGRFFADPFLIEWRGRHYVFFEDCTLAWRRGRISYCELGADCSTSEVAVALEEPHHLAYPFVFEHEGRLHLLPESADVDLVALYRADKFPGLFARDRVQLEGVKAVDPTLHRADGRCWLFANDFPQGGNPHDQLNLFWADSPHGPWTAHPANPLRSDAFGTRPASAVFERNRETVRPTQDCSRRYGGSVIFKRIDRLDLGGLIETEIGHIAPGWVRGNLGTHTYNRDSCFEVVDGRWYTSERWWLDLGMRACAGGLGIPGWSDVRDWRSWLSHGFIASGSQRGWAAIVNRFRRVPPT